MAAPPLARAPVPWATLLKLPVARLPPLPESVGVFDGLPASGVGLASGLEAWGVMSGVLGDEAPSPGNFTFFSKLKGRLAVPQAHSGPLARMQACWML